jgi:phage shock protein PspC (stress-responsive transcriptional regulator)
MADQQPRRLARSHDHLLGGVAAGIAEYFDLDPTFVRLAFVALALVGQGGAVLAYLILWIVMPAPGAASAAAPAPRSSGHAALVLLAVLLVVVLTSGAAWLSVASLHLVWISLRSLPVWILVIVVAWLLLRSRGSRVS